MSTPLFNGIPWASRNVSWSLATDGTWTSHGDQNNLLALYDAAYPRQQWVDEIIRAFAEWQKHCGLVFTQVQEQIDPSTGLGFPEGTMGQPQADSRFGDIRIFASKNVAALDSTWFPTMNPDTSGGDINLNGTMACTIGGSPDLWSLMLHCIGISLGIGENQPEPSVLNGPGPFTGLFPIDIQAAQMLYGLPPNPPGPPPATLPACASGIAHSWEACHKFVKAEYQRLLHREGSEAEIKAWADAMMPPPQGINLNERDVDAGICGSSEYWYLQGGIDVNWINQMYLDCLGRAASPSEVQQWQKALAGG